MRNLKTYLGLMILGLAGLTGCQDDFDAPNPDSLVPVATIQPTTTILDIKTEFWSDDDNYIDSIPAREDGSHYVVSGRVVSSDASGNIYNNLVIQDESAALSISVRRRSLYQQYPVGQEVVIDLTGMYIGKFSGLQQLGFPDYSERYGWQATFMPYPFLTEHLQLNGSPFEKLPDGTTERHHVDTLTVTLPEINAANGSPESLRKMQSRLVRINDVYFQDAGTTFCTEHKVTTNRTIYDNDGNFLTLRISGYANFWSDIIPAEHGDVVGILGYFNSAWQLLPIDRASFMNFGNPTLNPGAESNPWTVDQAIAIETAGTSTPTGWVKGYIVGAVAPEVTSVTSNSDIEWKADAFMDNTIVIASAPDVKDYTKCLVIALPEGSKMRQYVNLVDNPGNYGKLLELTGRLDKYMDTYGVTGNRGTTAEFRLEGADIPSDTPTDGDGTEAKPYTVKQVRTGATGTSVWVTGYIVGCVDTSDSNNYKYQFSAPFTAAANLLLAATPDETNYDNCVPVQLVSGSDVRKALNLMDNPANAGNLVNIQGNLETYFRLPGLKTTTAYSWPNGKPSGGDTPTPPVGDGGTEDKPYTVTEAMSVYATAPGTNAWVEGYIVGYVSGQKYLEGVQFTNEMGSTKVYSNVLIAASADETDPNKCMPVQLVSKTDARTALNLGDNPGNYKAHVALQGNIRAYFRVCGLGETSGYKILGGGSETPDNPDKPDVPDTPGDLPHLTNVADFDTFNGGAASTKYQDYSTASGWEAKNAAIQSGSANAPGANPSFSFISNSTSVLGACLNGKVSTPGTLTSPVINGGLSKLMFNYGFAFTDTKCQFTVNIKQNGNVVQSKTETINSLEQAKAYTFEWAVSVSGDFTIEIVNDCLSAATGNKDRVTIWNLSWDN